MCGFRVGVRSPTGQTATSGIVPSLRISHTVRGIPMPRTDQQYPSLFKLNVVAAGRLVDLIEAAVPGTFPSTADTISASGGVEFRPETLSCDISLGVAATAILCNTMPADSPYLVAPWALKDNDLREINLNPSAGPVSVNVRFRSANEVSV
jgi:hypothetical protein